MAKQKKRKKKGRSPGLQTIGSRLFGSLVGTLQDPQRNVNRPPRKKKKKKK